MVGIGVPEIVLLCGVGLVALVVMVGVAVLVLWLSRRGNTTVTMSAKPQETPLDILKARYARGELTKEQFDQMRQDLGG